MSGWLWRTQFAAALTARAFALSPGVDPPYRARYCRMYAVPFLRGVGGGGAAAPPPSGAQPGGTGAQPEPSAVMVRHP